MNMRSKGGRRKSDWIIPLIGLTLIAGIAFWAAFNYLQMREEEKLNHTLRTVISEHNRLQQIYTQQHPKTAKP